ncbi:hypothetical protein SAMN04488550_3767 [Gordonia malaquae]|uniref:Uncharacterized protein n=1 Tax=Gordonia malaquae NBRC 108250 TaxID=1223542 RepID=M3UIC5_GORML|nr:hypothetical protein [Gordonia malaquae]GAC79170.1 hypothetical protein GM1_007_01290 [Gordonia malaquae NBRC 108250]SEE06601.1 hypothetical protein SAMN04488550_3767 [Gordonia malaquae]
MIEIKARTRGPKPDPKDRPTLVVWAMRLWMISGALLIALGVLTVVDQSVNVGLEFGPLAIGVLIILLGVAYLLLGAKTYRGELQWRSSLSALTCVVVAMLLPLTIGFQSGGLAVALACAVIGLAGSLLAYRPRADKWFNCKLSGDCEPDSTSGSVS